MQLIELRKSLVRCANYNNTGMREIYQKDVVTGTAWCRSEKRSMLDSEPMRSISLRSWALVIGSSVLQALPFPLAGPVPLWRRIFCWFCLTPLLVALLNPEKQGKHAEIRQAAILGYLCGFFWYLSNCYWIYQTMYLYGGLPKPVALGILCLFSLYLGLYHALFAGLFAWIRSTTNATAALIAAPFLWVGMELARARITGFPWDLLGYTQIDNQLLMKLAPIGGVMMVSFVIAVVSAAFAAAWADRFAQYRWKILAAAAGLGVVLQFGAVYQPAVDASTHLAVLLQENLAVGVQGHSSESLRVEEKYRQFATWSLHPRIPIHDGSSGISWAPLQEDAKRDLIVWPEAPADFISTDPMFRSQLSGLARSAGTPVIAGSVGVDMDPHAANGYLEFGSAAVFDKDGSYAGRYDKIHRVPWGEYVPYKDLFFFAGKLVEGVGNMSAGTQHTIFHLNGHASGIFICYESIFGDEVREFPKNGAEVLINISDDGWYGDTGAPWQHLDMERMRAIENHRWILRDTNTGVTTSIDPHGRGVFETPRHVRAAFAFPFDYLSDTTFYTRHGDWFAWICAAVSVAFVAFGAMRRREVH